MSEDTTESHNDKWLAERLSVSPRTVRGWRMRGAGPPYVKLPGGTVRYRVRDVERWLSDFTKYPKTC